MSDADTQPGSPTPRPAPKSSAKSDPAPLDRRRLLGWLGAAGVAGAGAGFVGRGLVGEDAAPETDAQLEPARATVADDRLPQGLAGRVPAFGQLVALDLAPDVRRDRASARRAAIAVLRAIGTLADTAMQGKPIGPGATGLLAANLQVTVGVGASLLALCGLEQHRPAAFADLPAFRGDRLDPAAGGGDLLVQLGAEDPMVLAAAVQQVHAAVQGHARVRWSRGGFRPTAAASSAPDAAPRNLMGHHDGTNNPELGSPLWRSTVLVKDPGGWLHDGSYLVFRRIEIDLPSWFERPVAERDATVGRDTETGAPLGGRRIDDPVVLDRRRGDGSLAIGAHAHIRLAGPRNTGGARIHRRSWNYDHGWRANGSRDAGQLFLAWQADPARGFVPIQRSLAEGDDLNEFLTHTASALFAMPGRSAGEDYGAQRLMEA